MTPADAPVRASASPRDARQAPYGPDPLGWLTRPARRLYVDRRHRRYAPPPWPTSEGSGITASGPSGDDRRPSSGATPSAPSSGPIGRRPPGMAHAVAHGSHGTANRPPTATGYMGRMAGFRTTGLRTPTNSRDRRSGPPTQTPHRQPPRTAPGQTPVPSWGVGSPPERPHEGRPVRYEGGIPPLIDPVVVRERDRRRQDPSGSSPGGRGEAPKPEIPARECQETLQIAPRTTQPYSRGSPGGFETPEGSDGVAP